jgi:hypothetical protein
MKQKAFEENGNSKTCHSATLPFQIPHEVAWDRTGV